MNMIALAQISDLLKARSTAIAAGSVVLPLNVGDLGELIIAYSFPTWTRMKAYHAGYDFLMPDGTRVQLKTWSSKKRTHDKIAPGSCDRVIRLVIDLDDGSWVIAKDYAIPQVLAA